MRIHIGANSEGYRLATDLRGLLEADGHEVHWHAAPAYDEGDDYPGIVIRTVQAVVADEDAGLDSRAVLVGGTGAGEVIAGNKVNGGRIVSATAAAYVADARTHADINGLVIPAAHVSPDDALGLVSTLVETAFSNGLDDARRLVNVAEFETSGTIEGWMVEEA
ncbi:RpiB/LacA/LacB family sugar-phosphate isomerase [Demequina pelophila]|uniref:RpiB/LacA/LacB family sugar-phosphate isomerase n=1 Tax=Demequina pelophila TaxID=1638984 RepID=UPI000781EC57|nr:RpiB/LacA/LacB family sugar-phosphate isomerase [Demequina pelophila]